MRAPPPGCGRSLRSGRRRRSKTMTMKPSPAAPCPLLTAFERALRLQEAGQLEQAELLCRQVIAEQPRHFPSRHLLGLICAQRGNHEDAILELNIALAIDPKAAFAHYNRGIVLQTLKRFAEALASYDAAIALKPDYAEAFCNRGNTLAELKRLEESLASFDRAIALKTRYAQALANRGTVLERLDRLDEARMNLESAIALEPHFAEAHYNLANILHRQGELDQAAAHYERALAIMPGLAEAHSNLGMLLSAAGEFEQAVARYERALAIMPDFAEARFNLANALREQGRLSDAVVHYERALALMPESAAAHCNLGVALKEQGKLAAAVGQFERTLLVKADYADAHSNLAAVLLELGRLAEAKGAIERAIDLEPKVPGHYYTLSQIARFTADDPGLAAMEHLAREPHSLSKDGRVKLHFALGKAYADAGRDQTSLDHFLAGNALKRREIGYDEVATLAMFQDIRDLFTRERIRALTGSGQRSDVPIFIVGMPRSGTTLVEQILASHPQVFGGGELELLPRLVARRGERSGVAVGIAELSAATVRHLGIQYLAGLRPLAPTATRITDKMPANFALLGFIHLALPEARIIHVRRDPLDTCVSCFSTLFTLGHAYTYDLAELGRYYRGYQAMMEHWQKALPAAAILDVQYEDVVVDFEAQVRRILEHCGLPWDDVCLAFYKTKRAVSTASAAQVRRPVYATSVGRWRAYQSALQPLLHALDIDPDRALKIGDADGG
jgi:tetratricopeptide (TPR) repeat protein